MSRHLIGIYLSVKFYFQNSLCIANNFYINTIKIIMCVVIMNLNRHICYRLNKLKINLFIFTHVYNKYKLYIHKKMYSLNIHTFYDWKISETHGGYRLFLPIVEEMNVTSEPQYKYVGDLNELDQYSVHVNFMMLLSPSVSITHCCIL